MAIGQSADEGDQIWQHKAGKTLCDTEYGILHNLTKNCLNCIIIPPIMANNFIPSLCVTVVDGHGIENREALFVCLQNI